MKAALRDQERVELMFAALRLVFLNALRAFPHYIGAFFVGESLAISIRGHKVWITNGVIILGLLLIVYNLIDLLYGIHYDFGLPAFLLTLFLLFFRQLDYQNISLIKKTILLALFTIAMQFLDVMPALKNFPVGRGETSRDIKLIAEIIEGETLLNAMGAVGIVLFALFALLLIMQLRDENNLKLLMQERENAQKAETKAKLSEIQARTYKEIQYLVHDLKSPMTSIQTLVGILKMECEMEEREQDMLYLSRIEDSLDKMSRLISSILYENRRELVSTRKLVDVALAQVSVMESADAIYVENLVPDAMVSANQILFPRALVNLIQNSIQAAVEGRSLEVWLRVRRTEADGENKIQFIVQDNGKGISEDIRKKIWGDGVSGHGSSGLGLAFVKKVVQEMEGSISLESTEWIGTVITLTVAEEEKL